MKKTSLFVMLMSVSMILLTSCGPYQVPMFEEVKANETAFVIPLQGDNKDSQKKLWSKDYLESNKVSAKKIDIPQKAVSTGRMWYSYKWVPTVQVLKVNRTPVSTEWVASPQKGTSPNDDSFTVESADSVGFYMGGTLDCMVIEEDTALFLYRMNGRSLEDIANTNIRRHIAGVLTREFGKMTVDECKKKKADVFKLAFDEAKTHFKTFGITVNHVGMIGEITYINKDIQKAIDDKINAEMAVQTAEQLKNKEIIDADREAQKLLIERTMKVKLAEQDLKETEISNKKEQTIADKDLYVAQQKEKALETLIALKKLEVMEINAKANLKYAEKWCGSYPSNVLPENSSILFGNMFDKNQPQIEKISIKK
ncbi:hypothetical protein KY334_05855 [Candidatus Woesearchaeota archaeon]|nr:hypothetical protein [Candidatus Woesearchaeota archaeon]